MNAAWKFYRSTFVFYASIHLFQSQLWHSTFHDSRKRILSCSTRTPRCKKKKEKNEVARKRMSVHRLYRTNKRVVTTPYNRERVKLNRPEPSWPCAEQHDGQFPRSSSGGSSFPSASYDPVWYAPECRTTRDPTQIAPYTSKTILSLELLHVIERVIDQSKARRTTTSYAIRTLLPMQYRRQFGIRRG